METANRLVILEEPKQLPRVKCKDEGKKKVKKKVDFIDDEVKDDEMAAEETSVPKEVPVSPMTDDDFEHIIEKSMQDLETIKSDSDSDFGDDHGLPVKKPADAGKAKRKKNIASSSDSSVSDSFPPLVAVHPSVLPFAVRRRLSECVEEDEEEDKHHSSHAAKHSADTAGVGTAKTTPSPTNGKLSPKTEEPPTVRKSRFMVTKASELPQLRPESINLRPMTAAQNSQTIHFPCSQFSPDRQSLRSIFSPESPFPNPHLDKRFFDTSLVEIRPITSSITSTTGIGTSPEESTASATSSTGGAKNPMPFELDEVWVKRSDTDPSSSTKKPPSTVTSSKSATLPAGAVAAYASPSSSPSGKQKKAKKGTASVSWVQRNYC
nr:nucleolar protein dao-5-like [Aedes albopictus]